MKILFWIMIGLAAILTVWFLLKALAVVILYKRGIMLYGSRESLMLHIKIDGAKNVINEIHDYIKKETAEMKEEIASVKEETRSLKAKKRMLKKEICFYKKLTKQYRNLASEIEKQCDEN